jgi:glycosyltransferase involved in cell wall biosynthesis
MSFAQFRPEKDHELQLRVWRKILPKIPVNAKFILVGSVRDAEDQKIVDALKRKA